MKTIGILGGLGPESTIAYYATITRACYERRGDYAYPEIIIHSASFREFIDAEYELPDKVLGIIEGLKAAGADFVVAACNSVHVVYAEVAPRSPIPWISIMDAVAEPIKQAGMKTIGLLGTVFTMGKGFYAGALARHGIATLTPDADDQQRINDIIFGELVRGEIHDASRDFALACMNALAARGAEGIVLGCTELPFLIKQEHTDVTVFDTTDIHARKALDLALGEGSGE